jgi:uncharacterized membrane protein (DUF373 family)
MLDGNNETVKPPARQKNSLLLQGFERFEQAIVLLLMALIGAIVLFAVYDLTITIYDKLIVERNFDGTDEAAFRSIFGMVLTVIIALEFKRSLLVSAEQRRGIVQARVVVLIGLLAMVRKVIVDMGDTAPMALLSIAAMVLALGAVYWLIREQDRKDGIDSRD